MEFEKLKVFETILHYISDLILSVTVLLLIGWQLRYTFLSWNQYKAYILCRDRPVFHPTHTDVKHLSKLRELYNHRTYLTKYIIIVICCTVEIICLAWSGIKNHIQKVINGELNSTVESGIGVPLENCTIAHHWSDYFHSVFFPIIYHQYIFCFLLFVLLCILTRYLSSRYMRISFKRTLTMYLLWYSFQCCVIAVCANSPTFILSIILFPLLSVANWSILLRDSLILSRVLKSNIRELKLFSSNQVFYEQQLAAYKFYRISRIFLMVATLFLILTGITLQIKEALAISKDNFCILRYLYNIHINSVSLQNSIYLIEHLLLIPYYIFLALYTFFISLPLWVITVSPVITQCIKRYRDKEENYRFNYDYFNL